MDHLNINHEKGRHDWLTTFYFDFLNLAIDPRKEENLKAGQKTVWANAGANQFHLPEGKPNAQVLEGIVTLVYSDLEPLRLRLDQVQPKLQGSLFAVQEHDNSEMLIVTDPWGSTFHLVQGVEEEDRDPRGKQPGDISECLGMRDLTIYTSVSCNTDGIARFYNKVMKAPILHSDAQKCVVSVGPRQTLTFQKHPDNKENVQHEDLRDDKVEPPEGCKTFQSNYGPHVSMYIADFSACYKRADELGVTYVNPRFKRRAYSLEEAVDDCMFRLLDIVDPDDGKLLLRLEHEVRNVVKRDGSKYKSCPFDEIPSSCVQ